MKENYHCSLECIFCNSTQFELPCKDYQPQEGDMLKCANCGRLNDFTSIKEYIINRQVNKIKQDFTNDIRKMFKGNKFLKLK